MILVELRKLFRRPRTWATIAVLNALPLLVACGGQTATTTRAAGGVPAELRLAVGGEPDDGADDGRLGHSPMRTRRSAADLSRPFLCRHKKCADS